MNPFRKRPDARSASPLPPPPNYAGAPSANSNGSASADQPPPAYTTVDTPAATQPEPVIDEAQLTAAFASLRLTDWPPRDPDTDTCLAHLKLLFAFRTLQDDIGYTDGLWGIWDSGAFDRTTGRGVKFQGAPATTGATAKPATPGGPPSTSAGSAAKGQDDDDPKAAVARLREKRWALFLARAVDRYESWWASLGSGGAGKGRGAGGGTLPYGVLGPLTEAAMGTPGDHRFDRFVKEGDGMRWTAESLLPLGECRIESFWLLLSDAPSPVAFEVVE